MSRYFYQDNWGRRKDFNTCSCENQYLCEKPKDMTQYKENEYLGYRGRRAKYDNSWDTMQTVNDAAFWREVHGLGDGDFHNPCFGDQEREDIQRENIQSQMVAPINKGNQYQCCPFDAYGINTYGGSYTPINVVRKHLEDLYIPFTVSVKIPVGFILPLGCQYRHGLAMDKHQLTINNMTQYYVYTNGNNCSNTEVVKMQIAVLNGPIYYNLTVSEFIPAQPIQDVNLATNAYFNSSGIVPIDKILSYSAFGYESVPYYTIDVNLKGESITLPEGRCVPKKTNSEEYQCLLANPDIEKTLNFSYVLVIKARCTN